MEFESINSTELRYEKTVEGSYRTKRILYIVGVVVLTIALCALCCLSKILLYMTPIVFMMCIFVFKFLYIFLQIEFRYTLERGIFTMYRIFGNKRQKEYFKVDLHKAKSAVSAHGKENPDGVVYDCSKSLIHPSTELYLLEYEGEGGKSEYVYFEATKKALKIMKYYLPELVVSDKVKY